MSSIRSTKILIVFKINVGNKIFDTIDTWFVKPNYSGYSFGYGMETVIGPVEIKHSWSPETKDHYTWFSVGFWF